MTLEDDLRIHMIPIKLIEVLNPRVRGKRKFAQIVENIFKLGLKKPITLARIELRSGEYKYLLVCGQGRLEGYVALGQEEIPAILVRGTKEELLLRSLAENLARRQHSPIELVREISALKEKGYSINEIGKKTDLVPQYVRNIIMLLNKGEERLLVAVENGKIPVSVAITIATADDKAVQRALTEAYEQHDLKGNALTRARQLIDARRVRGKGIHTGKRGKSETNVSGDSVLKTYRQETIRQKMLINKAKVCETRLLFAVTALKQLFQDENLVNLLRAEGLDTVPQFLADQLPGKKVAS